MKAAGRWASTARFSPLAAISLIVLLAVACRAGAAGSRLHIDDAYSWYVASAASSHAFLTRLAANENTPPLFYLLLGAMPSFSAIWLRIPSIVTGVLLSPAVYLLLRDRVSKPVALISALAVAVAPFLVTYADLARGFMLADLALLVCLWTLLAQSDEEKRSRWLVFVVSGAIAIYTEYDSAIVLIAMIAMAIWIRAPRRGPLLAAGAVTFATMGPWIPQIVRAQNQVGLTKYAPMHATPSFGAVRDLIVTLVFGEGGGTSNGPARTALALIIVAFLALCGARLAHRWSERDLPEQRALLMLAGTAGLTVVVYALAAAVGIHVFSQRYLTILIVLIAPLAVAAVLDLDRRWIAVVVSGVFLVLGIGNAVRRVGGEYEPSFAPVRATALADHPQTVLTNTPVSLYYLPTLHVIFDRPYNLGPGLGATCGAACLTIDDSRVSGGTSRTPLGPPQAIGPYVLSLRP